MTPEERARRAVAVRALMDDRNVRDAFASVEADLVAEWKMAQNPEERQNLWLAVRNLERLQTWLRSAASHDLTALRRQRG